MDTASTVGGTQYCLGQEGLVYCAPGTGRGSFLPSFRPSQIYCCHPKLLSSLADRHWKHLADWLSDTLGREESEPEEEWETAATRGARGVAA